MNRDRIRLVLEDMEQYPENYTSETYHVGSRHSALGIAQLHSYGLDIRSHVVRKNGSYIVKRGDEEIGL